MKFEKTVQEDHQAKVVVEVEPDRLEAAKRRAARKISEQGKIPGFRPGKAPYEVIRRHYSDAAIYERAVELLVDETYPLMLKEADLKPAAAGTLENVEGTDVPKFTFLVPLLPEVELGDYGKIRQVYEFETPGEDKLQQAIDELQQMYSITETVEREAQEGDYILADLKSERESLTRTGFATMIRKEDRETEFPFPGFARQLLGLKAGEAKTISHEFPKDFSDETLAGETVEMEVTVRTVRSVTLPELNDDFAKMVGQYENFDALKEVLKKDVEERARADYDDEYFARLIDTIKEGATIKYAAHTLDHEAEHVVDDLRQRLSQQGLDLETYYKMRNTDAAKFLEEEAKPVAQKRLERSLIMDEISREQNIEVDNETFDAEFNNTLMNLQMQGVKLNEIKGGKKGQQQIAEAVAMESANRVLTRRTLDRLKAIATGEFKVEKKAKVEELVEEAGVKSKPRKTEAAKVSRKEAGASSAKTKAPTRTVSKTTKSGASATKKPSAGSKSTAKKPSSKK